MNISWSFESYSRTLTAIRNREPFASCKTDHTETTAGQKAQLEPGQAQQIRGALTFLAERIFPTPFFPFERCSPNILPVPHLQDSGRVHLQLCLQEIDIKLIHYLKMLLSFLLIKSTFLICAEYTANVLRTQMKHWLSVLYFSDFGFIYCPQHAFLISRRAASDLSYS